MASPRIEKDFYAKIDGKPAYVIAFGRGRKYRRWAPNGAPAHSFSGFRTRSEAKNFIRNGGLNVVVELPLDMVLIAAGWDREAGFCEANYKRFGDFCKAHGIFYYAVEKTWEISGQIEHARRKGYRFVTGEILS